MTGACFFAFFIDGAQWEALWAKVLPDLILADHRYCIVWRTILMSLVATHASGVLVFSGVRRILVVSGIPCVSTILSVAVGVLIDVAMRMCGHLSHR